MAKREPLLKLPDDFEGNMRALLATPPADHGTPGSRKAAPKPKPKPKKERVKRPRALAKQALKYSYEMASVLRGDAKPKKRKAKKR